MADVIDKGNYYLRSHNLFLFVSLIAVSYCLWICVCSSISRRVAFSREIWRAIYRSLPEHQAWCCCCCFVSLSSLNHSCFCLSIVMFLLSISSVVSISWTSFLLMSSPDFLNPLFLYRFFIACFDLNYWSEQKEGDWLHDCKSGLGLGRVAWLTSLLLL